MKIVKALGVLVLMLGSLFAQTGPNGPSKSNPQNQHDQALFTASGQSVYFIDDSGTGSNQFGISIPPNAAPATLTLNVYGCMRGGPSGQPWNCTTSALSSSTGTATQILPAISGGPYDAFLVSETWTGGSSATTIYVTRGALAKNNGGQGASIHGSLVAGHCVNAFSATVVQDAGAPCGSGTGNVSGPGSSAVGHIALFNNTSGTLLSDSTFAFPLANAQLANSSVTFNGQAVALGASGNIPFQTNGSNNTSLAGLNFTTSAANAVGLTVTPVNSATNAMKFEITGSSYTGNAGTATALAATPTNCGAGVAATGVAASGNAVGCFTPGVGTVNTGVAGQAAYYPGSTAAVSPQGALTFSGTTANFSGNYGGAIHGVGEPEVDGTINTNLLSAVMNSGCFNAAKTIQGCNIRDDRDEIFQASPFLGGNQYYITFFHGNVGGAVSSNQWLLTRPLVLGTEQILGSGRSDNAGSAGTRLKACVGEAACGGLYFWNPPPPPPTPSGTPSTSGGTLAAGTYKVEFIWLWNNDTAPDSLATASQPAWASGTFFVGQTVTDGTTNCGGAACTQVAIVAGTSGGSAPSWNSAIAGKTTDGGVTWSNAGNFTATTSYGSPGMSRVGGEYSGTTTGSTGSIAFTAPAVGSYAVCSVSSASYTNGTIVAGLSGGAATHLYRVIGSGTTAAGSCNMSATAGSQTADANNAGLIWQEVGPLTNFPTPLGYVVAVTNGASGTESIPASGNSLTGTCTTVQVGDRIGCAAGQAFTLTSYTATTTPPPLANYVPTIVKGVAKNNATTPDNPATRVSHLTIDTGNIAAEAILNLYAQEQTIDDDVNTIGGYECPVLSIGGGARNSAERDMQVGNGSPGGGIFYLSTLAGAFCFDNRLNGSAKTFAQISMTPYNQPTGAAVAQDMKVWGTTGSNAGGDQCPEGEGVYGENATSINYVQGALVTCFGTFLGHNSDTNVFEIDASVGGAMGLNVTRSGATVSVKEDRTGITGGARTYTTNGSYFTGVADANGLYPMFGTLENSTTYATPWVNDGGLIIATLSGDSSAPLTVTAKGLVNGFQMSNTGAVTAIGSGTIAATTLTGNLALNQVVSPTGAIATFVDGNNPLIINCALTSGTTCVTHGETTAATTAGAVELQLTTLTTSTAIGLQVTQGANGPANANAPSVLNISAAAAGGLAGASNNGSTGAPIALLTGAGSAGGATTGNGGAGGNFTMTQGNGGAGGGTTTNNGGAGGGLVWTTGTGGNAAATGTSGAGGSWTINLGAGGSTGTTLGAPGTFGVAQGANLSATNSLIANFTTTWNNAAITGPAVTIAVTNTSSSATATVFSVNAGAGGLTSEFSVSASGQIFGAGAFASSNGTFKSFSGTNASNFCGGGCTNNTNAAQGGNMVQGSDASANGSSTTAGYGIFRGGLLTNATPNAAALEGVTELESGALKGTAVAAVGDVVCGTSTAFTVTDCSHTGPAVNIVGIATSTTNPIGYVTNGQALVKTDGAVTIGDILCMGTTTDGQAHDNGTVPCSTAGAMIGVVLATSGTITTASGASTAATAMSTTLPLVALNINPVIAAMPATQTVTGADYTNTTVTPSTLFSWTLPATAAAKSYKYSCDILWESTAATLVGPQFGVNISAAPTQLTASNSVQNTLAGADVNGYISNTTTGHQNVGAGTAAGVTTTNYWARMWGTIEGAPTAGSTFIIDAASTSGTTASLNIRRGSSCTLQQIVAGP